MAPRQADRDLDIRQSPIGFYNLGLSYLQAADEVVRSHLDDESLFALSFEHPIRHLYAHGWELCLKACLYQQGNRPSEIKTWIGHRLTMAWDAVDKERFAELRLTPDTRHFVELLDDFHPTKFYAYPITGVRREHTLTYVRAASKRFYLARPAISKLFGTSLHDLG